MVMKWKGIIRLVLVLLSSGVERISAECRGLAPLSRKTNAYVNEDAFANTTPQIDLLSRFGEQKHMFNWYLPANNKGNHAWIHSLYEFHLRLDAINLLEVHFQMH